jgi:tetratricopeptide (TPR) repeat protein
MPAFEVPEGRMWVPRAFEAAAWSAATDERFQEAIEHSWSWLLDEPFATRAALFGSFVAGVAMGDDKAAVAFARSALQANPADPRVLAQLVYNEILLGNLAEGERLLSELVIASKATPGEDAADWPVIIAADKGLLAFRRGDVAAGREFYREAITTAQAGRKHHLAAIAGLNLLAEEARIGSPLALEEAPEVVPKLLKSIPASLRPIYAAFASRIRSVRLEIPGVRSLNLPTADR